jgi:hypothetical protein
MMIQQHTYVDSMTMNRIVEDAQVIQGFVLMVMSVCLLRFVCVMGEIFFLMASTA